MSLAAMTAATRKARGEQWLFTPRRGESAYFHGVLVESVQAVEGEDVQRDNEVVSLLAPGHLDFRDRDRVQRVGDGKRWIVVGVDSDGTAGKVLELQRAQAR